jgi:hypothetical protein
MVCSDKRKVARKENGRWRSGNHSVAVLSALYWPTTRLGINATLWQYSQRFASFGAANNRDGRRAGAQHCLNGCAANGLARQVRRALLSDSHAKGQVIRCLARRCDDSRKGA